MSAPSILKWEEEDSMAACGIVVAEQHFYVLAETALPT